MSRRLPDPEWVDAVTFGVAVLVVAWFTYRMIIMPSVDDLLCGYRSDQIDDQGPGSSRKE